MERIPSDSISENIPELLATIIRLCRLREASVAELEHFLRVGQIQGQRAAVRITFDGLRFEVEFLGRE